MRHNRRILLKVFPSVLVSILFVGMIHAAEGQQVPVWESAETIRKLGAEAQAGLFRDNPELATMEAKIAQLSTIYADTVQSALASVAPETDRTISNAIDEARQAVTDGDGVRLALARGQLWTHLLHGSFAVTQAALDAGNVDDASEWLRLREYRRSTIVNLVSSPADAAMQQVRRGTISPIDAKLIVASDLRDTTFFRLREALNELDDAIASEFPTRAAEWVGKVQGYFALLKEDYRSKQGDEVVDAVQVQLQSAGEAALLSDWASLTAIREELSGVFANYQPIAFSEEQLAERAQLLFLYTELIWIEYRDAVRNGEISIDIEYQETITFRNQAQAVYEELRPTLAATAPADADRLADIYVELEQIIMAIGPKADVEVLVVEASELIVNGLGVDPEGNDAGAALTVIDGLLDQVITAVEAGDYEGAENARIEAYAFFETGPEVKLANRAPRLAREIEGTFWEGTQGEEGLAALISASASLEEIQTRIDTLRTRLTASEEFLNTSNTVGVTILNSAAIIIREGLEAVLIIGAIIGFMRASAESRKYIWWVGAGVMAAILLSVGIWWASFSIITISFSNRELIEGLTALVAVAVLFYVTNWLFQKVYVRDWMSYVKEQVGKALTSGSAFGLAFLGFAVVFREGFETVLFYQTLLFDSEVQPVVIGFLTGLVVILVVAYLILQMSVRLPLKPFFTVTTILLLTMAFNFMGKGIRGLQEAGYVSTTWLSWVPENLLLIELFGIYPTVETTLAQVGFVLLVLGTFGWSIYQSKQQNRVQAAVAN